jgi:predicted nucleic acid-binding protein
LTIVVGDASVVIDILQMGLLREFLDLRWQVIISALVVSEVQDAGSGELDDAVRLGQVTILNFDSSDLEQIQEYSLAYPGLSIPDCSCLHLAKEKSAILLTGERLLRSIASGPHTLEVHGLLWVLDQLVAKKILSYRHAHSKLERQMAINKRLPLSECKKRLSNWSKKGETE